MDERRDKPRFRIAQFLKVGLLEESFLEAKSKDLSESGLACFTSEYIEPSTQVYLMLRLEEDDPDSFIKCEGMTIWCTELEENNYEVGIEFTRLFEVDRKKINRYFQPNDALSD
jgi:hypothetical protein